MSEARSIRDFGKQRVLADGTITAYEVFQAPNGEAGVYDLAAAVASGSYLELTTRGTFNIAKTTSMVILKGGRVYWDHSANLASYRKVNDRDFYIGRAVEDATSSAPVVVVDLNSDPRYDIDLSRDPFYTAIVGTQAINTMGLFRRGGAHKLILSSTNEAQKVDMLSKDGFAVSANAIVEFAIEVVADGSGSAPDASFGVANATHATDADSITDSLFCHLNGNDVNIYFESDDGTTEVAATDSTLDYTEGTRFEVWFDMRDPADVQVYVNAALVLGSTVFNVAASVATWKLLAHVEKTAAADTYDIDLDWMRVRYAEQ